MRAVKVRNIEIGTGMPKICVPVVAEEEELVIKEIDTFISSEKAFDIIEWRADYFGNAVNTDKIMRCLKAIREHIKSKVLVFTFRTAAEGGMKDISCEEYEKLNEMVIESGCADIVDIQMEIDNDVVNRLIYTSNKNEVYTIVSHHDFKRTPYKEAIIKRLVHMHEMGADIAKIAVMPNTLSDVCAVLGASAEMVECYADKPFVAISMSGIGFISRICGEVFGSAITYGTINKSSAPGQAEADELGLLLNILHKYL